MNRLVILIVLLSVVGSCSRNKDTKNTAENEKNQLLVISGKISGAEGRSILVDEMGAAEFIAVDTFQVAADASFSTSFHASHPAFYALRSASSGYITLIAAPGDSIHLEAKWDSLVPYSISGSPDSEAILRLALEHRKVLDEMALVSAQVREAAGNKNFRDIKQKLDLRFDSLLNSFHAFSLEFIKENGPSLANLPILYNQYGPGLPVFNPSEDFSVYELVDSLLYPVYPDNDAVKALHQQVEAARLQIAAGEQKTWKEGDLAPAFVAKNTKGEEISLSDFRGHYLILGFWAAWSKPSCDQNTYLKTAWNKYHEAGLEILQVSLDDDRTLWLKTISEDKLDWTHTSELRRWDSQIANMYHIDRIPYNILIGPDGKILAVDLYGEELVQKTATFFSK